MAKRTSYGTCSLCNKRLSKAGITRHLKTCTQAHDGSGGGRPVRLFHIRVEGKDSPQYWINLEIQAKATLQNLDSYLRRLWLDCCGHLSAFTIGHVTFSYQRSSFGGMPGIFAHDLFDDDEEQDMEIPLEEVLEPGMRFLHDYDFGSTTTLVLRVTGERRGRSGDQPLRLLARNEEPDHGCDLCDRKATQICIECTWAPNRDSLFCEQHATDHECGEDMLLPVVNSPRMGVCAYSG